MIRPTLTGILGAAIAATVAFAPAAGAQTITDRYPETPKLNPALPIVTTTHGSDGLKANILNPHPVCNASEDYRTSVFKVTDDFMPVGTVSTTNQTSSPIPLTQKTSKQQTISIKVNGSQTETVTANFGGNVSGKNGGGQAGIAYSLARQIGGEAAYSLSWTVGQDIGPYQVQPGYTGEATYGFRTVSMTGTQQFCLADGTWSNPMPWNAMVPLKNEVVVKQYDQASGGYGGTVPTAATPTSATPAPAPTAEDIAATTPATATDPGLDLAPHFTVSSAKAEGFAGTVAVRVKNVGGKRYFQPNLATTFRVDVHTASGPQGVDRVITPRWMNGAYVRDLGFDEATSTRSFEITLSNPVDAGDDQLIGAFDFGDGLTREGRIVNSMTVTQTGRLAGDASTGNDQNVDSRSATTDDFGRTNAGLF